MRHLSALAAVALVFSVTAALADPVGNYWLRVFHSKEFGHKVL